MIQGIVLVDDVLLVEMLFGNSSDESLCIECCETWWKGKLNT